jgi:hypothetical protein
MVNKKEIYQTTLRLSGEGTYSLMEQLEEIVKREKANMNMTLNLAIRKAIEEYVVRHGAGNNSFQLDKFGVTWTKAVSVNKCGFANCGELAVAVGLYVPKNQTFGMCRTHFKTAAANPKVWRDLKITGEKQ